MNGSGVFGRGTLTPEIPLVHSRSPSNHTGMCCVSQCGGDWRERDTHRDTGRHE